MDERIRDIVLGLTANPALPDHLRARLPGRPAVPPRDTTWHVDNDLERAADPTTSPDDVTALLGNDNMAIRWTLAARSDLSLEARQRLAADPIPGVRAGLAANPVVVEPILRELANDASADVRRGVAHNPAVPLDVLVLVVESTKIGPVGLPRVTAATDEELRLLAASPSPRVRMLVAQRTALPSDVFELLVADDNIQVVKGIAPHPALSANRLRALAARHGPSLFRRLATNPNCDPELLHHMACHATARRVYRAVAEHPNTRAETLLLCLGDDTARRWAAEHPNLPTDILIELVDDPELARHAAANPALPIEVMESLIAACPRNLLEQ
ncbi:hypothetical protein ACFWIW_26115 [Amycolatopsis sp. NPDC058340]|uniref:hypothetical protein n=1 Tax=Amycolatopsis sp. NPDC058340 TaxID=3346453 RepID=UPI00365D8448